MKPSTQLHSAREDESRERHEGLRIPRCAVSGVPPTEHGVSMHLVRDADTSAPPLPAQPTILREFLTRFEAAGLSTEVLTRALGLPPSVLAGLADSTNPPRWFVLALGGLAAARGIPAAELAWLRAAAEQAE